MNAETSSQRHVPALDGVRGMAILAVVLYHNFGLGDQFYIGWLGVDLFFVLSGYLITTILLETIQKKNFLRNFYLKRILRIFPLYYLVLFIFFLLLPALNILKEPMQYYTEHQGWFWLFLQNWLLIFNFPPGEGYFNHFWSLAVEEQFYLIWPFIILWLQKPKKILIFLLIALIGIMAVRSGLWLLKLENFNYTLFYRFTRIDGICIGSIIAVSQKINRSVLSKNTAVLVLSLAVLNFLFFFLNRANQYEFPYLAFIGYTTFAAMFGILINEVVIGQTSVLNFIFNLPVLRFLGTISYGLYIFHWPAYVILLPVLKKYFKDQDPSFLHNIIFGTITTLIAVLISVISYYGYELKFLKLKKRLA